jgi:hypothetical protein
MAHPQVGDGRNSLYIWRTAANILNKKSQTVDKGSSSSLGLGKEVTTPHHEKEQLVMKYYTEPVNLDRFFSQGRGQWQAVVNMVMNLRVPYKVGNFLTT